MSSTHCDKHGVPWLVDSSSESDRTSVRSLLCVKCELERIDAQLRRLAEGVHEQLPFPRPIFEVWFVLDPDE